MAAAGVPGYEAISLFGLLVPDGTPQAIVSRLNRETVRVMNQPDVRERYLAVGMEVIAGSPEQFAATIKSEVTKWEKVIKEAGIRID